MDNLFNYLALRLYFLYSTSNLGLSTWVLCGQQSNMISSFCQSRFRSFFLFFSFKYRVLLVLTWLFTSLISCLSPSIFSCALGDFSSFTSAILVPYRIVDVNSQANKPVISPDPARRRTNCSRIEPSSI